MLRYDYQASWDVAMARLRNQSPMVDLAAATKETLSVVGAVIGLSYDV